MGEKKNSEAGLVLAHLYVGKGFPELDEQVSVTLALISGFPCRVQTGVAGGTARYRKIFIVSDIKSTTTKKVFQKAKYLIL